MEENENPETELKESAEEMIARLENLKDPGEKALLMRKIGNSFSEEEEWDTARQYYERSAEIFAQKEDFTELSKVLFNAGTVSVYAHDFREAVKQYEAAAEASQTAANYFTLGNTMYNMRQISGVFAGTDRALAYYEDRFTKAEKAGKTALAGFLAHEIALILELKAAEGPPVKPGFFNKLFGKKEAPESLRNFKKEALSFYETAIECKESEGVVFELGDSHLAAGLLREESGQKEAAFLHYLKAVENVIAHDADRNGGMAINSLELSLADCTDENLRLRAEKLLDPAQEEEIQNTENQENSL